MRKDKGWDSHVATSAPRNDSVMGGVARFVGEHGDVPKPGRVPLNYTTRIPAFLITRCKEFMFEAFFEK